MILPGYIGLSQEIEEALAMIRERFPANAFPYLSLEQTNDGKQPPVSSISFLPSNNKVRTQLPGVTCQHVKLGGAPRN